MVGRNQKQTLIEMVIMISIMGRTVVVVFSPVLSCALTLYQFGKNIVSLSCSLLLKDIEIKKLHIKMEKLFVKLLHVLPT